MNEPKRRGRPTNAEREARAALADKVAESVEQEMRDAVRADMAKLTLSKKLAEDGAAINRDVRQALALPPKAKVEGAAIPEWPEAADIAIAKHFGVPVVDPRAQAYALRVWNGQSIDVPRNERIRRVKLALEGQNLPFEGVELP